MIKTDTRTQKTDNAVRDALCELLGRMPPEKLTIKGIARKSGVHSSAVRKRGSSPWALLAYFDAKIIVEFRARRSIQINDLEVGDSLGDFFMLLQRQ